jgi:integral membrane protein (TIGR01906 family)
VVASPPARSVGAGLGWAHARIRAWLVTPFASQGDRVDFLTADERAHLRDVKRLFDGSIVVAVVAAALVVWWIVTLWRSEPPVRARVGRVLVTAGVGTVAVMIVVGIGALLDFGRFWDTFHEVVFPQGNWEFAFDSVLIRIYPPSYFEAYVLALAVIVGCASAVMTWVGWRLGRHTAPQPPPSRVTSS